MQKSLSSIALFFLHLAVYSQYTVRVQVTNYVNIKDYNSERLFITGSFNSWNPADNNFKMLYKPSGVAYVDIKLVKGTYEYKICRGDWGKVECRSDGLNITNRILKIESDTTISITIESWKDNFSEKVRATTASKNVKVIDTAFLIPQLNRVRRVLIYLPENYSNPKTHYPVLYIHDGQNVFDDATSFAGEWGVDEFLDSTKTRQCIVVAIDNGGNKRMNEYSPYDFTLNPQKPKENKGEGSQYVDFLAKTLKPFIDKKYRTQKEKKNTFITGSSMGGLISFYAILKYPKVFGGAGIFSPSVWICKEDLLNLVKTAGKKVNSKIYFYCGKLEGTGMVPDMLKAFEELATVSKSKMTTVIRDDGKHNEPTWRKEFPLFYEWIMQ
jgi:predicted alpha/beta superfamily hydrolase